MCVSVCVCICVCVYVCIPVYVCVYSRGDLTASPEAPLLAQPVQLLLGLDDGPHYRLATLVVQGQLLLTSVEGGGGSLH